MMPLKITWVCEPHDSPSFHLGPNQRFIDEIGRHTGVTVPRVSGRLCDVAPDEGFILLSASHPGESLAACATELQQKLAARMVPLDVSRSRIFDRVLEGLSVPAAVDSVSHLEWSQAAPDVTGARGPYGLRSIGTTLGAPCGDGVEGSRNYCYLTSATHQGLPHLLADFLIALHKTTT